ncbi:hypothetical protein [Evansella tamaricis]|uniref:Uncharacterized protein n=1 Tax=Evansella tamaricis TaxID=2069301 RepID=A0ABS6JKW0_9BACI|nr:hypothetical protein [Evansella tamaricis]MBU9714306.1 hypothetical protein [Evansella tamaricis]
MPQDVAFCRLDGRTGRPNIGHATGRGVLPDGRTLNTIRKRLLIFKSSLLVTVTLKNGREILL